LIKKAEKGVHNI
jgi:hypothetical protein